MYLNQTCNILDIKSVKFIKNNSFYFQKCWISWKRSIFIKNYLVFIKKNYIDHIYKKLQPQISGFIKNLIFGNNRDPCWRLEKYC